MDSTDYIQALQDWNLGFEGVVEGNNVEAVNFLKVISLRTTVCIAVLTSIRLVLLSLDYSMDLSSDFVFEVGTIRAAGSVTVTGSGSEVSNSLASQHSRYPAPIRCPLHCLDHKGVQWFIARSTDCHFPCPKVN